jgi:hypothetical protein
MPIYKNDPKGNQGKYRPASLMSMSCKFMEWILKSKIMIHLFENELIRPCQHGLMPGKSCASNLTIFLDKATKLWTVEKV